MLAARNKVCNEVYIKGRHTGSVNKLDNYASTHIPDVELLEIKKETKDDYNFELKVKFVKFNERKADG